jgi:dienelactone hydrolase
MGKCSINQEVAKSFTAAFAPCRISCCKTHRQQLQYMKRSYYFLALLLWTSILAADSPDTRRTNYFRAETELIARRSAAVLTNTVEWKRQRNTYRKQLFEMLGLDPLPPRGDLKAKVTGKVEREDFGFVVEKLHFQSLPGLYVTANLYLPKQINKPVPAVLYLCGHGPVIKDGVSYGNKVHYQHHGIWFARHGYACLMLDTVQLGEIQGLHDGTYRYGTWWWNARGYTPGGVEAWNCIRALDYLETRTEIDKSRFAVTGRSGGGAYSWLIVALDDRIQVAAAVAGLTGLEDHVINGAIEAHCDCMFMVNTYQWDYAQVAALAAPRPLLIVNTDRDRILPLDGVVRVHSLVREIYRSYDAESNLGLVISDGPHQDTQDLQVPVFRWLNRYLKDEDPLIERAAIKLLQPEELKVFAKLPGDAINTNIHDTFVPKVQVSHSISPSEYAGLLDQLKRKSFAGWPVLQTPPQLKAIENGAFKAFELVTQPNVNLRLVVADRTERPKRVLLSVVEKLPAQGEPKSGDAVVAYFAPRGLGDDVWTGDATNQVHIRRRFMLLGQTVDSMRVWDIRQAIRALQSRYPSAELHVEGSGIQGVNLLYAALYEPGVAGATFSDLPASHEQGPDYLNVLRVLDIPVALKIAESKFPVVIQALAAEK